MNLTTFKTVYARAAPWAFPVLVVLLILCFIGWKCTKNKVDILTLNVDSIARTAEFYKNQKGQQVAQNKQLSEIDPGRLKNLTDSVFSLTKKQAKSEATVSQYAEVIQQYKLREKLAGYTDTADLADNTSMDSAARPAACLDTNYMRVPRPFEYKDSMTAIVGKVRRDGVLIDSVSVENTLHFRTVDYKAGFLGLGRQTVVQALNSNPAVSSLGVTSIVVPHKLSWWDKWGKPVVFAGLGVLAGSHIK